MTLILNGTERQTISVSGTEFKMWGGNLIDLIKPGIYRFTGWRSNVSNPIHVPFVLGINPTSYRKLGMQFIADISGATLSAKTNVSAVDNSDPSIPKIEVSNPGQPFSFAYRGSSTDEGTVSGTYTADGIDFVGSRTSVAIYLQSIYAIV